MSQHTKTISADKDSAASLGLAQSFAGGVSHWCGTRDANEPTKLKEHVQKL
jgi:hypothetical protein